MFVINGLFIHVFTLFSTIVTAMKVTLATIINSYIGNCLKKLQLIMVGGFFKTLTEFVRTK